MNSEKENLVKSVTLSVCFILILAIIGWTMPIVIAAPGCIPGQPCPPVTTPTTTTTTPTTTTTTNKLKELNATGIEKLKALLAKNPAGLKIKVIDDKGNIEVSYGDDPKKLTTETSTLEKLKKSLGGKDIIKVGQGDKERSISLKDVPEGLGSIEVGEDGKVTYTMKDNTGNIVIDKKDVYVILPSGKSDAKDVIELVNYKEGETISALVKEGGSINVLDNSISYEGDAQVHIGSTNYELSQLKEKPGSIEFIEGRGHIVKNSRLEVSTSSNFLSTTAVDNSNEGGYVLSLNTDDKGKGIFFGEGKVPTDLEGRSLSFKNGKLSGDLSKITDKETITLFNNQQISGDYLIDKKMLPGTSDDTKVPKGKKIVLSKKKNEKGELEVRAEVSSFSQSQIGRTTGTPTVPQLPTTPGINPPGGTTTTPPVNITPPPYVDPGTGPYGGGGGGGSTNWLLWALIIGGAALAAILLLGGSDDDGGSAPTPTPPEDDGDNNNGGSPSSGSPSPPINDSINRTGSGNNRTFINNPTLQPASCTYDVTGYHNCPNNDCSQCGLTAGPLIQESNGSIANQ